MSRVTVIENATVQKEVLATRTTIMWNQLDNSGSVQFDTTVETRINGELESMRSGDTLSITLEELAQRNIVVDGQPIPYSKMMQYMKQLFADLHAETTND